MSATEDLRRMLDERGAERIENDFGITWSYYADPHTATESMDGTLIVTGLTPEQAIAATLGDDGAHAYEQAAIEAWGSIKKWNSRAHGTLTAEQVRGAVKRYATFDYGEIGEYVARENWQAIADELNATLGGGTCRSTTPDDAWCFACSECGKSFPRNKLHLAHNHGEINYCPNCGKVVKR